MSSIPFGAIVLIDFPFTDLTSLKRRPALVVSADNDRRSDVIVAYITSLLRAEPDSGLLEATADTGLKTRSRVRFDKLATLQRDIIAGRIGMVPQGWLQDHAAAFYRVFGFAPLLTLAGAPEERPH